MKIKKILFKIPRWNISLHFAKICFLTDEFPMEI